MQNSKVFTAIDIGTTKVFTVIGRKSDDGIIEVLGHGVAPCNGVRKGMIEDVSATQAAVKSSVGKAERISGVMVNSAFVGITGRDISYEKSIDTIDWVGEHGVITHSEMERVPVSVAGSRANGSRYGRKVIHAIPHSYSIDGMSGLSDPMGIHTRKIDVETHLVQGSEVEITKLDTAVKAAGIEIEALVLEALASSESVLMQEEKIRGAAMVDIGGGTTDVMVYKNGSMHYSSVIPVGGYQFTNDICVVYNTTFDAAEDVKLNLANVLPNSTTIHEHVSLPIYAGQTSLEVSLHDICRLTRERAQELIRMIVLKLKEGGVRDLNEYPIVLTGGGSKLRGFEELFKAGSSAKVRMGAPLNYYGIPRELQQPMYSAGTGMLLWAIRQQDDEPKHRAIGDYEESRPSRFGFNGNGQKNGNGVAAERKGGILSLFRR